ncbi:hypothetical protein EGYY_28470 [Eggerthella sp. YY7918]|nr:hypothetical protein EGYY_28470 [Eggerthella sp. YY7918]
MESNATCAKERIGSDRLLSIQNVSEITGLCPVTASVLMKESGREIVLHRRKFILESSLLAYLRELEVGKC